MPKDVRLQKLVDEFAKKSFGRFQTDSKFGNVCVTCGKKIKAEEFKDLLSIKEYKISGMCQQCQEVTFGY